MPTTNELRPQEHAQELDVVVAIAEVNEASDAMIVLPHHDVMVRGVAIGRHFCREGRVCVGMLDVVPQ